MKIDKFINEFKSAAIETSRIFNLGENQIRQADLRRAGELKENINNIFNALSQDKTSLKKFFDILLNDNDDIIKCAAIKLCGNTGYDISFAIKLGEELVSKNHIGIDFDLLQMDINHWKSKQNGTAWAENCECPVCGKYTFDEEYDICPYCGWENDAVQYENPDFAGGANRESLNEYKKNYKKLISKDKNYMWNKTFKE